MPRIEDIIGEAIEKALSKKVEVYRGTVGEPILKDYLEAKEELKVAYEAMQEKRKEFWGNITTVLNLDPGKDYFINELTGQVFERVFEDDLKAPAPEMATNEEPQISTSEKSF